MVCLNGHNTICHGWALLALIFCLYIRHAHSFLASSLPPWICSYERRFTTCQSSLSGSWVPDEILAQRVPPVNDAEEEAWRKELEDKSLDLMATLIHDKIDSITGNGGQPYYLPAMNQQNSSPPTIVHGLFVDLCEREEGEKRLEDLFNHTSVDEAEYIIVLGAIASLHSVLVLGMNYGLSGTPEQFEKWMSHLSERGDDAQAGRDYRYKEWDASSTRRLKLRNEKSAGLQLLARLDRKRSPQGAFDLLVSLGVWTKHEDLALLRSGFPIRFSKAEIEAAMASVVSFNYALSVCPDFQFITSPNNFKCSNAKAMTPTASLESDKIFGV